MEVFADNVVELKWRNVPISKNNDTKLKMIY